jgi:phosphotransferase system HPr (HPr) family protein
MTTPLDMHPDHKRRPSRATITSSLGLRLRAATRIVEVSQRFEAQVLVICKGRAADSRSVLDLVLLGAGFGADFELEAAGPDSEAAIAALCALIQGGFQDETDSRHD